MNAAGDAIQGEGERGLGSTLLGGASGVFIGKKICVCGLGSVGGSVLGAIGANLLDKHHDK